MLIDATTCLLVRKPSGHNSVDRLSRFKGGNTCVVHVRVCGVSVNVRYCIYSTDLYSPVPPTFQILPSSLTLSESQSVGICEHVPSVCVCVCAYV